jgi:hypothetical protein
VFSDAALGPWRTWWDRRASVGCRGEARLCMGTHTIPSLPAGETGQPAYLDVEIELWNRTRDRITLLKADVVGKAAGQLLVQGTTLGSGGYFAGASLQPASPPVAAAFALRSPADGGLVAQAGDGLEIRFRQSGRGRRPRVHLVIQPPREAHSSP